jgi:hypothetical protein
MALGTIETLRKKMFVDTTRTGIILISVPGSTRNTVTLYRTIYYSNETNFIVEHNIIHVQE